MTDAEKLAEIHRLKLDSLLRVVQRSADMETPRAIREPWVYVGVAALAGAISMLAGVAAGHWL